MCCHPCIQAQFSCSVPLLLPCVHVMSLGSESDRHEAVKIRSQPLLQEARDASKEKRNYDLGNMQLKMQTCLSNTSGFGHHDWQLDVAESLLLGLDSIIIAG